MADWQWVTRIHRSIYQATGGRIGSNLMGIPMVMMHTIGAKSGQIRSIPVACYDHPEGLLILASNNGGPKMPAWYYNMRAHPEFDIQFRREKRRVRAQQITEAERLQYWDAMADVNPRIVQYWHAAQAEYGRTIPVILLRTLEVLN
ncbi:nitroreductase family deazaflavin-dependent oxidoreductase [Litorivivens sp.]|uniref:nitroreductase family deazaflavin-dependent oxidoreductase n=1 Tax=Litorivivens sp. TaxID=2020868 RepID=UPI0035661F17